MSADEEPTPPPVTGLYIDVLLPCGRQYETGIQGRASLPASVLTRGCQEARATAIGAADPRWRPFRFLRSRVTVLRPPATTERFLGTSLLEEYNRVCAGARRPGGPDGGLLACDLLDVFPFIVRSQTLVQRQSVDACSALMFRVRFAPGRVGRSSAVILTDVLRVDDTDAALAGVDSLSPAASESSLTPADYWRAVDGAVQAPGSYLSRLVAQYSATLVHAVGGRSVEWPAPARMFLESCATDGCDRAKTRTEAAVAFDRLDPRGLSSLCVSALPSKVASGADFSYLTRARDSDCDSNVHVNNSVYLDWVTDALGARARSLGSPASFPPPVHVAAMFVDFVSEIVPGEEIEVLLREAEPGLVAAKDGKKGFLCDAGDETKQRMVFSVLMTGNERAERARALVTVDSSAMPRSAIFQQRSFL